MGRLMVLVSVLVVTVTVITILLIVHTYRGVLTEAFDDRSAAYVAAFADSANAWLESGDEGMLKTAASFLLLGSVLYVQVISSGGELIVDDRAQAASSLDLSVLSGGAFSRRLSVRRLDSGKPYIDFILPQTPRNTRDGGSSGYVRMGIDTSSIGIKVYGMTLIASGIGSGFDIVVLGLFSLLLRRVRRESARKSLDYARQEGTERVRQIGGLVIDESSKRVSLDGKSVRLTPKQYALLLLLASDAGRVFSEREILESVWAESDYADSKDVKQYIYLLRRRLAEASDSGAALVINVPGFGYKIEYLQVEGDLTDG